MFEFVGKSLRPLDEKGRLVLPREYVAQLQGPDREGIFVTPGKDGCLWLVPQSYFRGEFFKGIVRQLQGLGGVPDQFFHVVQKRPLDKAGRVLLDQDARELAALPAPGGPEKVEVYVCGSGDYVQVWEKGAYERTALSARKIAQSLPHGGNFGEAAS